MDSNTDMIGLFSIESMSRLKSDHITQGKMDELDIKTAFRLLAKIIVKQECWRSLSTDKSDAKLIFYDKFESIESFMGQFEHPKKAHKGPNRNCWRFEHQLVPKI